MTSSASDSVVKAAIIVQEESVVARPIAEAGVPEAVRMTITERKMTFSLRCLRSVLGVWAGVPAASGEVVKMAKGR